MKTSFIELGGLNTERIYHVNINHIDHVYTENSRTVVRMISGIELHVADSANVIIKQIHFILNDEWTDVKRQVITDLISKYGFEEGNRRYVEGEEKKFMEGLHYVGERFSKKKEMSKATSCPHCGEKHDGECCDYTYVKFCRCLNCDQRFLLNNGGCVLPLDFEERVMKLVASLLEEYQATAVQNP